MKVLYLINFAGKAGTEKYVENLVRILGKDKIQPYFAYNIDGELSQKMKAAGVPCLKLDMGKKNLFGAAKQLAEYCRNNEIELIHAQYPRENLIALLSKRHYDKPKVVMTSHLTLRLSGLSGLVWKRINKHFSPKNHRIISVCGEGRDILIENGVLPERISVIFNGIEPATAIEKNYTVPRELGLADDCFIMTILARYAPEKGLDFLLEVLQSVKRRSDRPFCCLICGDGELFGEIGEKIAAMGLSEQCKQLGYRTDVPAILHGSDIYLCTSSHNEAMSFAILEAMNAGLPPVVTDVGGNRDLAETRLQCGFVHPYGDVEGFAGSVLALMKDSKLLEEYSSKALEKIQKYFDLNRLAGDVFEAYK